MKEEKTLEGSNKNIKKIINLIPGDLIYRGGKNEKFSIERYLFTPDICVRKTFNSCDERFKNAIKEMQFNEIQWINVTGINHVDEIKKIGDVFKIDAMILEQILNISKHSSYKFTDEYIYNDIQMVYIKDGKFQRENISIFFIKNTIITFQEKNGDIFDSVRERLHNNQGYIRNKSSKYTYFSLLDSLIDHYLYTLEDTKYKIEMMELKLMEDQRLESKELHDTRQRITILRISAYPIEKLTTEFLESSNVVDEDEIKYFDSLIQHIRSVISEVNVQKETIDSLYENYMMTNANEMNHVMTILTIFSAIFIPLSFLASVFGMNFLHMPILAVRNGFSYFMVGCFFMAALMITYFKKKKWF